MESKHEIPAKWPAGYEVECEQIAARMRREQKMEEMLKSLANEIIALQNSLTIERDAFRNMQLQRDGQEVASRTCSLLCIIVLAVTGISLIGFRGMPPLQEEDFGINLHSSSGRLSNILCDNPIVEPKRLSFPARSKPRFIFGPFSFDWMEFYRFWLDPRSIGHFQGLFCNDCCISRRFGGTIVGAINSVSYAAIDSEPDNSQNLHSKRGIVQPVLLALFGLIGIGVGWWHLKFCSCWRDWWIGMAGMILGCGFFAVGFGSVIGVF